MKRGLMLGGLAACVFVVVAVLMLKFMPAPLKESDYMVIGSVATLLALGAVFLVLVSTTMKSTDVFLRSVGNKLTRGPHFDLLINRPRLLDRRERQPRQRSRRRSRRHAPA